MADVTSTFAAKDVGFTSTVNRMQGSLAAFQSGIASFAIKATALVGGFLAARSAAQTFSEAIDFGGRMNDLAARTGETAGNLVVLRRAFENAGLGGDEVGSMLDRLSRFMVSGASAGSEQAKTLTALGLSFDELQNKSPTEKLQTLATAVASIEDPAIRTQIAMDVFGRSGGALMPLLRAMGSELDLARAQVGSLAEVMDRSARTFDSIGDSFNAIAAKGMELASGILEKLAPSLARVSEQLATIDAAGFGQALGNYILQTAQWASETLKVNDTIAAVKTALQGLAVGEIGKSFELLFNTVKIVGLNAINEIAAGARAAFSTVGEALQTVFDKDSVTFAYIRGSFEWLGAFIAEKLSGALADVMEAFGKSIPEMMRPMADKMANSFVPGIRFMGEQLQKVINDVDASPISKALRDAQDEAAQASSDYFNLFYHEAGNLKKEWADVGKAMPENFAKAYEQYAKSPLFDLSNELTKQKDLSAELASNIRAAGISAGDFANALNNSPLKGGSLMDRLAGGAADSPFPETTRGGGANIPLKIDPAALGSSDKKDTKTSAKAPATALETLTKAAETDARARASLFRIEAEKSRRTARVPELIDKRFFSTAAEQEVRAESLAERQAQDFIDSFVRDQQMTPEERKREEDKATGGGGGGGGDPIADILTFLKTKFDDFKERVPQNALS